MKVLQICKKSPLPPKDGESLAIHQITKAFLSQNAQVDVLCMLTPKHNVFNDLYALDNVNYFPIKVNTQTSVVGVLNNLIKKEPYIVERFYSVIFKQKIIDLLKKKSYDYIILEGVFLGLYLNDIKQNTQAKIVLRAHNVEHKIWERIAKNESNLFKKIYLNKVMNGRFKTFEEEVISNVDAVLPISPIDEKFFKKISAVKPIFTIPVTVENENKKTLPKTFEIGFIGGMDWQPNLKGVQWFLKEVWKPFVQEHKDAKLHLAGRNFPKNTKSFNYEGVKIHGEVESAISFINSLQILVVPIFSGSGMRVKIIEAMSLGRCVLSTSIGAEGINYIENENIIIANTKQEWLDALINLKNDYEKVLIVANNGKTLVEQNYRQTTYAELLLKFIKEI